MIYTATYNDDLYIKQLENELFLIRRQVKEARISSISIDDVFSYHGNEAMLEAKFYHECKMAEIPCVLQVRWRDSRLDAIVEIENDFIVIELKILRASQTLNDHNEQFRRYIGTGYPLVIITNHNNIIMCLNTLKQNNLANTVYYFDEDNNLQKYIL